MKKSVLLAAGVCLLSGMTAFADPVTSVNAVGVTKIDLPVGFSMIACPFNAVGGQALSLDEMFGANLPEGSYVFIFVSPGGYIAYVYADTAWRNAETWDVVGSDKILRGEGFWVYCPSSVSGLSLAGEVPASSVGTNRVDLMPGFQIVSFAFPQEMVLSDSGLVANEGDYIFKWVGNGLFNVYVFADGEWRDAETFEPASVVLKPNEGFWYRSNSSGTNAWNQVKTYQWP